MSLIRNVIIQGQQDGGGFVNIPADVNGHLEVAIHSPRLPFGAVHTENLTPIFQADAVYGINAGQLQPSQASGSGAVTGTNNVFSVSTVTTIYSQAVLQGTWTMKEARLESSNSWQSFPSTEPPVTITETHVSNPWNTTYTIVDETIVLNNQFVKVEVKKNDMLWVFENTDSLRFTR